MKLEDKYQIVFIGLIASLCVSITAVWALVDYQTREYKHFEHEKIMLERLIQLETSPVYQDAWENSLDAVNQYFESLAITK